MIGKSPIGVFDSGYGGLTILSDIQKRLPQYDFLYLGDNARAPYGNRSFDVVYEFTLEAVKELFDRGCELVILACNTASAKALRTIQHNDLPLLAANKRVLGVIRPSTEVIGEISKTNHVGILATEGTIKSLSYPIEISKFSPDTIVTQQACPMWVPLIENGQQEGPGADYFVKLYIDQLFAQSAQIDTVLLACTHYPLMAKKIQSFLPDNVKLVTQGDIVAKRLATYLQNHPEIDQKCSKNGQIQFYTTDNPTSFEEQGTVFFGQKIAAKHTDLA